MGSCSSRSSSSNVVFFSKSVISEGSSSLGGVWLSMLRREQGRCRFLPGSERHLTGAVHLRRHFELDRKALRLGDAWRRGVGDAAWVGLKDRPRQAAKRPGANSATACWMAEEANARAAAGEPVWDKRPGDGLGAGCEPNLVSARSGDRLTADTERDRDAETRHRHEQRHARTI